MTYTFTDHAVSALEDILHYIAQDNQAAATRINEKVFATCDALATMPDMDRHPEFATNSELLYFPIKKYNQYLIFYRKSDQNIVVVDIIHGARDLPDLFA